MLSKWINLNVSLALECRLTLTSSLKLCQKYIKVEKMIWICKMLSLIQKKKKFLVFAFHILKKNNLLADLMNENFIFKLQINSFA